MARLACLLLLCGFVLAGCATDDGAPDEGFTVAELEKFDAYPLYYAGEKVAGHELEKIVGAEDWQRNPDQRSLGFVFIYGTCELSEPSGLDGGSCAPPLQIQVSSICEHHLGLYRESESTFDLRGAKAANNGVGLEVFTGRTFVKIYADPNSVKTVIRHLRRVGRSARPKRLPPPPPGGPQGKLPCQQKRG